MVNYITMELNQILVRVIFSVILLLYTYDVSKLLTFVFILSLHEKVFKQNRMILTLV